MMRFCVILIGLAASAAYSHDEVALPEVPAPEVKRIFPVAEAAEAYRWAGREVDQSQLTYVDRNKGGGGYVISWYVVELSESQYEQYDALLGSIQEDIDCDLRPARLRRRPGAVGQYPRGYRLRSP